MEVYCVMVLNGAYLNGARLVSAKCRELDPLHPVWCLAAATFDVFARNQLEQWFDGVKYVELIASELSNELKLLNRPDLVSAVTKFRVWELDFAKVVYLDADTLPLRSLAPLFAVDLPNEFSVGASPDSGWPDTFNSGVMVLQPHKNVFEKLVAQLNEQGSFDGADQGVLNECLHWVRLPFTYNVTINSAYEYAPAYNRFAGDVKLLHFIGAKKPWNWAEGTNKFVQMWWDSYNQLPTSDPASRELTDSSPTRSAGGTNFFGAQSTTKSPSMSNLSTSITPAISQVLVAAESANYAVDETKINAPPPDYWDALTHEPLKSSNKVPQRIPIDELALAPKTAHVFPKFGPSLVQLPFEAKQKPAERIF